MRMRVQSPIAPIVQKCVRCAIAPNSAPSANAAHSTSCVRATGAAKVDLMGSYSIRPADKVIGLPAGRYQFTIRPPEAAPVQVGTDDYKKRMMGGGNAPPAEAKSDIPAKFVSPDPKHVLEIKAGANTIDLDLSKL